jgi:DNA-binding CsgD family transcriptional regulator
MSHHPVTVSGFEALPTIPIGRGCLRETSAVRLVGRDREQRVLADLLGALPRRGGALVLRAEPGMGKSALLAEAVAAAARRGLLVLSASGTQSETNLAFAGLHQLLRPVLGHLGDLPPRQRCALAAAFGMADGPAPELFLIALAALQLLSDAAARNPVVLAAEDAQWLDRPTADVLAFIARRVESDPVLVLAAVRDGYPGPLLAAGLRELRVAGLAGQPAQELLDARFPRIVPDVRRRVLAEAQGNPLALIELPAALGASVRDRAAVMPDRLPLTKRLEEAFAARAADLPPVTRALLLVAAADDDGELAQVMRAAGAVLGAQPAISDLVPGVDAHLIESDGHVVRFRHPLMRSAIYQAASLADRQAAHAALADALADDPDRRAWHRAAAAAAPCPQIAAELEEAARRARGRGGVTAAAAAFERAAAFTSDPGRRGALLLRAAEAARELGHTQLVLRLLREAGSCPLTVHDRAYAMWLGDAFSEEPIGDPARVRALAETARQVAADGDTPLALGLLSAAAFRCYWSDLGDPAVSAVLDAADRAGAAPDDPLLLQIQAYAAPLERGPAVLGQLARVVPPDDPEELYLLGSAACLAGDFRRSCSLLGASAARLREQGRLRVLTHALAVRAWTAVMFSDYQTAMPVAAEAARLAAETGQPLWEAGTWTAQAALAALRGERAATEALTARVEEHMLSAGAAELLSLVQYARGLLALGFAHHAEAWTHLRRLYEPGDPARDRRIQSSAIGDLAEAAAHSGHRDDAREILDQFRPLREQTPWFRAVIGSADALLAPDDEAEARYRQVLTHDLAGWPFLRARLQLSYGEWLRRQHRSADSRPCLRAARDAFDVLGTVPWSERARRELRAAGETSRRRDPAAIEQLTPQELQIIQLAADGLTNREIGQVLYLSHRTVESHLYRVFPKLGITSRAQLGTVISDFIEA